MFSGACTTRSSDIFPDLHVLVVHDNGSETVGERPGHLGCRIRDAVSDVGEETADVPVLNQTGNAVRDVVEESWSWFNRDLMNAGTIHEYNKENNHRIIFGVEV